MIDLIQRIADEVDKRFNNWAFRGSLVDWHYFDGNVIVKDFDIVTSDQFEPDWICPHYGPRMIWRFMGRAVDVFYEPEPGPRMQPIDERVARLEWLAKHYPHRVEKSHRMIERYKTRGAKKAESATTCPHRGDQLRTMTSDLCGTRGHNLPVYACELHGECTHRKVCRGQDAAVRICVGCSDGPWAFT